LVPALAPEPTTLELGEVGEELDEAVPLLDAQL
jgi:hypothetical protein